MMEPARIMSQTVSTNVPYDLLVVGGGVNGAGIARDDTARGATVPRVAEDDTASSTASPDTRLVHRGLRDLVYL